MSNEKKYTPGPWRVGRNTGMSVLVHDGDPQVAQCYMSSHDARLIAAAPELLEALEEVVEYHEGRGKYNFSKLPVEDRANAAYDAWQDIWRKKIHAAIAKALGE